MWEQVINMAVSNGIWAVLFCVLLLYQLQDGKKRESKYQQTISSLSANFVILKEVHNDIQDLKTDIQGLKRKVTPARAKKEEIA